MIEKIVRVFPVVLAIAVLASPAVAGELEQKNKAVARTALEEMLGRGRIDENESIYEPDFVSHGSQDLNRAEDRKGTKEWRRAFPDLHITIDKIVAEGDLVAVRFLAEGTNTGQGNGLPPTGKAIRIAAMTILRIVDGKIVEEWPMFDQLDLMTQLGLMPKSSK